MASGEKPKQQRKKGIPVTYKIKVAVLSALVAVLAIIYILILVLDRDYRRSDVFAWLDTSLALMADRIEITGSEGRIALNRRNNVWVFDAGNMELPVRQNRVEDLFTLLSRRAVYPVRAASREAAESLLLTEETAFRILVRGGVGLPLLDLMIGAGDVLGREVFLRMADRNQIHSGDGDFISFTNTSPSAWYDLGLFRPFTIDMVQQADIVAGGDTFSLRRSGTGWTIPGDGAYIEPFRVEAWLRSLTEAQGEDFVFDFPDIIEGSITLYFGDGSTRFLEAGDVNEHGHRNIMVSDSSLVYSLSDWAYNRIFRERTHFLRD